jgi:glycerophosphoryl diester phosphodiesterase
MRGNWLFILFLLFACKKKQDFASIEVIGHAAMGLENVNSVYHDNTLEAIELACSMEGSDGIEIDVQLSKDGELFLFHDERLDEETNGTGCIYDKPNDELMQVRYSTVAGERLAKLTEISTDWLKNKSIFLDIRHYSACQPIEIPVLTMIDAINQTHFKNPDGFNVNCILSTEAWLDDFIQAGFPTYYNVQSYAMCTTALENYPNLEGFVIKNHEITKEEVAWIRQTGKKVYIFEVRSPKGIREALGKFPDGLITDDLRATLIEKY